MRAIKYPGLPPDQRLERAIVSAIEADHPCDVRRIVSDVESFVPLIHGSPEPVCYAFRFGRSNSIIKLVEGGRNRVSRQNSYVVPLAKEATQRISNDGNRLPSYAQGLDVHGYLVFLNELGAP